MNYLIALMVSLALAIFYLAKQKRRPCLRRHVPQARAPEVKANIASSKQPLFDNVDALFEKLEND